MGFFYSRSIRLFVWVLVHAVCISCSVWRAEAQELERPASNRQANSPPSKTGEKPNGKNRKDEQSEIRRKLESTDEADKVMAEIQARIAKQKEELELLKLFAASLSEIEKSYIQKVDRRRLIEAAIDGMLHDLDRYSDYIPAKELTEFQTDLESEYGGIGIRVTQYPEENFLTVTTPILDSPSYEAGVEAGTWITRIGELDARGFTVDQAIEAIQGEIGTKIKVTFRDKKTNEDRTLELARAIVPVRSVLGDSRLPSDQWDFFLRRLTQPEERIGYVRIVNFGRQTIKELQEVMSKLVEEEVQGLIIDLRFNPGGLLSSAVQVCDLFVDRGLIVRTEGRNALPRKWAANRKGTLSGFPIAVLVNKRSASASEIVAACLKDSGRATIVGERTFGKGSVQNVIKLDGGKSVMKLTTATYFRPNGQNIHRLPDYGPEDNWGVKPTPDYEVNYDAKQQRDYFEFRRNKDVIRKNKMANPVEEFKDLQLEKALESIRAKIEASASSKESKK